MGLKIVGRYHAPKYSKEDYPYIERGFIAANYKSAWDALETFYTLNNETTNVISQLLGLLVFVVSFLVMLLHVPKDKNGNSGTAEAINYHYSLMTCLFGDVLVCSFSLACHTWQARNERWHTILSVMDWGGTAVVAIVTCGIIDFNEDENSAHLDGILSFLPTGKAHFLCVIVAFIGLIALFAIGNTNHAFRFYSIFVVATFVAIPEIPTFLSAHSQLRLLSGVLGFLIGGTFFSTHLPERVCRKTFDLCCSSHTLWHFGYLLGLYQLHSCLAIAYTGHVPWEEFWVEYFQG